jgi:hypothetical protein
MPRRSKPKKTGQQSKRFRELRVNHRPAARVTHKFLPMNNPDPFGDSPICRTCKRSRISHDLASVR